MKKKIKLRDLTQEENVKWREKNCTFWGNGWGCNKCIFYNVMCIANKQKDWIYHKDLYSDKFLDQEIEIEAPDILDKEEKEYLSNVIKPFRNRVKNIVKKRCGNQYYIIINMLDSDDRMVFPYLPNENMYKNMEALKQYDLEELGL